MALVFLSKILQNTVLVNFLTIKCDAVINPFNTYFASKCVMDDSYYEFCKDFYIGYIWLVTIYRTLENKVSVTVFANQWIFFRLEAALTVHSNFKSFVITTYSSRALGS